MLQCYNSRCLISSKENRGPKLWILPKEPNFMRKRFKCTLKRQELCHINCLLQTQQTHMYLQKELWVPKSLSITEFPFIYANQCRWQPVFNRQACENRVSCVITLCSWWCPIVGAGFWYRHLRWKMRWGFKYMNKFWLWIIPFSYTEEIAIWGGSFLKLPLTGFVVTKWIYLYIFWDWKNLYDCSIFPLLIKQCSN